MVACGEVFDRAVTTVVSPWARDDSSIVTPSERGAMIFWKIADNAPRC